MAEYLIFFNQQWVGDHSEEWFHSRQEPSTAVVNEMKDAGVLVFAGGLVEELEEAFSADATSGEITFTDGPFVETKEYLGGLTIVDVPDEEAARMWGGKVAEGCGWPQEVRRFGDGSLRARLAGPRGADLTEYLVSFNQQWVGDHPEEWFHSRREPSTAVINEMKDAGVLVFAGGLTGEVDEAFAADATSGEITFTDGPFVETKEYLGGLTLIDVPDEETARLWAGKIAEGCGWPQEVRPFKPRSIRS